MFSIFQFLNSEISVLEIIVDGLDICWTVSKSLFHEMFKANVYYLRDCPLIFSF